MATQIPKIFHFMCLHGDLPKWANKYMQGWQDLHPDWTINHWTMDNLPELYNKTLFDQAINPAHKSQILRYDLVYQFGGIYLDWDMECRKNIEPLLDDITAFGSFYNDKFEARKFPKGYDEPFIIDHYEICIFGGVPGHRFYEELVTKQQDWYDQHPEWDPIWNHIPLTAGYYAAQKLCEMYPKAKDVTGNENKPIKMDDFTLFPPHYFIPVGPYDYGYADQIDTKKAYAGHKMKATWQHLPGAGEYGLKGIEHLTPLYEIKKKRLKASKSGPRP